MGDEKNPIRVGTRKSQLALVQTQSVLKMLKIKDPTLKFETLPMSTTGDKILGSALSKIGEKSLFTKELEEALLRHQVDFVVHSLKDLPTYLPDGLVVGCVCKRDSPYDAVVIHPKHAGKTLKDLAPGSVIGTSSLRRAAQLQRTYPELKIENIRGNLNTRFQKLAEHDMYDAMILAVAGLERLNWHSCISQILYPPDCMYAVSQGAMAVECRANDERILKLLGELHDHETTICCVAERSFLKRLEGGCSVPVATCTEMKNRKLTIHGGVFSTDGAQAVKECVVAELDDPKFEVSKDSTFVGIYCHGKVGEYASVWEAGIHLADKMIADGADEILRVAKAESKGKIMEEHEKMLALKAAAEAEASAMVVVDSGPLADA